jgi:hypothetical protein
MTVSQDPPRDGGEPEALGRNPGNRDGRGCWRSGLTVTGDQVFGAWLDMGHEAMSMGRGMGRGLAGHAWLHLDCTVL